MEPDEAFHRLPGCRQTRMACRKAYLAGILMMLQGTVQCSCRIFIGIMRYLLHGFEIPLVDNADIYLSLFIEVVG